LQSASFKARLEQAGLQILLLPAIETVTLEPNLSHRQALGKLANGAFDWVIFTSANGVRATFKLQERLALQKTLPSDLRIAVVGRKTANSVAATYRRSVDLMPSLFTAAELADAFAKVDVRSKQILLVSPLIENEKLSGQLQSLGAAVESLPVYQTVNRLRAEDLQLLKGTVERNLVLSFFSPSAFRSVSAHNAISDVKATANVSIASIGPVTSQAIRAAGWRVDIEAPEQTEESLADAIIEYLS
jgi:uroporphyrinogen III methyltransferase/synthase